MPYMRRRLVGVARQEVVLEALHQGRTSSSGCSVTALTTALAGEVSEKPRPSGSRPTPIASAIRSIISP